MANLIKNQSFQKLIITFIRYSKAISLSMILFSISFFSINIQGLEKIPVYNGICSPSSTLCSYLCNNLDEDTEKIYYI